MLTGSRYPSVTRDTLAELVMLLLAVSIFAGATVVCGMAAFVQSAGLPGGRILPVLGFVAGMAMASFATWRLFSLRNAVRS